MTGGAIDIHTEVFGANVHLHLLGLGQHDHLGRGGVDATLRLSGRHPLHAVRTALEFQPRVRATSMHLEDDLLEAADAALIGIQYLNAPAMGVGVARVPSE